MKSNVSIIFAGILVLLIGIAVTAFIVFKWEERQAFLSGETAPQPDWSLPEEMPEEEVPEEETAEELDLEYGWEQVSVATTAPLYAASFIDKQQGIAFGAYGIVIRSADRGEQWRVLATTLNERLYDAVFFNESRGVAVGDGATQETEGEEEETIGGTIITTDDGGMRWGIVGGSVAQARRFVSVSIRDADTVFALRQDGMLIASDNRGQNWREHTQLSEDEFEATDLAFFDEAVGVASGSRVFKTEDGGESWRALDIYRTDAESAPDDLSLVNAITIRDEATFFGVTAAGYVISSTDGGSTWMHQRISEDPLSDVLFVSENQGYVAGTEAIYETTDGGESWEQVVSVEQPLHGLAYNNANTIIGVGERGVVVRGVISVEE